MRHKYTTDNNVVSVQAKFDAKFVQRLYTIETQIESLNLSALLSGGYGGRLKSKILLPNCVFKSTKFNIFGIKSPVSYSNF